MSNKIDFKISRLMTLSERKRWKQIVKGLSESYWDTIPKQEAIMEYVQAVEERRELQQGLNKVRKIAAENPTCKESVGNLKTWMDMIAKVETKLNRLRGSMGFDSRTESNLEKKIKAKGAPKGGHRVEF